MTELFERNLELFSRINPYYKKFVQDANCKDIEWCETEKGESNLRTKIDNEYYYYHSQKGALDEAKQWFDFQLNCQTTVWYFFGLGLGYYYDALKDWLKDPKHFIIFCEDDFRVIHRFLETEKATEILNNPQVFVVSFFLHDDDDWVGFRRDFNVFCFAFCLSPSDFKILPLYQLKRNALANSLRQYFILVRSEMEFEIRNVISDAYLAEFPNFYHNFPYFADNYNLKKAFNLFKNVPSLICGAGPSIKESFPLLQEIENKALLFGAGSSLNTLSYHSILPHFAGAVDPNFVQRSRHLTHFAYQVPLIYLTRFNHLAYQVLQGDKLCLPATSNGLIWDWFQEKLKLSKEKNEEIEESFGISTTSFLTTISTCLGSELLVLAGIDLSYKKALRYAEGVEAHPTDDLGIRKDIKRFSHKSIPGLNAQGEEVETTHIWQLESIYYTDLQRKKPHLHIINSTISGIKIVDIETQPLDKVISQYFLREYDIQGRVHTVIQNAKFQFEPNFIKDILDLWKKDLSSALDIATKNER